MGMDPVFGLPATRDSKAMDNARNRNISHGKRLEAFLKSLDENASTKNVKIISRQAKTKEMLHKINPDPDKKIVTPIGLNQDQVKTVRLLRRGSLPSMSLKELDHKLSAYKTERGEIQNEDKTPGKSLKSTKNKFSEFKIKRKLYRGKSKITDVNTNAANLVDEASISTLLPLYRRKSLVSEAYYRITSSDIVHARARDHKKQKQCQSDTDISTESTSTLSSSRSLAPKMSDRMFTPLSRRNTMPDINSNSARAKQVQFEAGSKTYYMNELSRKSEFDSFLETIKKGDKLPAL